MFDSIGIRELVIIAVVALLLFGSKRIPQLAQDVVQAMRHFRNAFKDDDQSKITKK